LDLAYRDEIDRLKPIQDERDAAARELAARLAADAVLSLIEAKQKDDATIEFRKQAKLAHKDHADALAEASRLENDRAHAEKRLQQVIDQRTKAIEAGLLDSDERADHARERDRLHASKLIEQIANNDEQVKRHQGERTLLDSADENAAPLEGTVRSEIRATKESIDRATRQRDRLIADPLVVEVAESSNIDLDLVGSAIADRLVRRAAEADKSRLELELRAVEHKRAVDSLAETGLLPPSVDVEVVARRLNEAGLRGAIPGTRYIADAIASDRWEHVASLRADLVGGIVLTNRDDLPKAQSILETAALAPSTVIAVGTASSLTALENSEPGDTFIVPPSPALWDKSAAAAERAIRAQKLSAYDSDRAALEERATGARRLAHDMTRYAEEFPPGWLAARKAEHATLAGELGRLENERQSRANRKREIAASTKRLLDETVTLHSALDETNRRIAALVKLADAEAETAEFPARIERLRVETEEWRVAAGAALKKAEIAIEEAQQASNAANDYRTAADRTRLEVSEIHLSETLSYPSAGESAALKAQTPDPSALRARFHAHHQRLVGTTSESRVAAQREEAIKQRNLLKNSIDANQLDVRTRAEILLAASDAADMAGRRRAAQRAETERTLAAGLQKEAYADLDKAKDTLRVIEEDIKRSKRQIQIPPEKTPRDRHQANLQAAEARQRADNLQVQHAIAETDRDAAARRAEEAKTLAEGLERLCKTLSITLQLTEDFVAPAAPAYEGTLDDAINAADKTAASVTKALKDHQGAEARWHAQDDAVRKLLTRDEFADLSATDRLHRRLTQSTMEVLARDVGSLVADLRTSITVLRADLSTQEQDIKLVTTSLAKTVNKALSSLHQAQTRSKMPTALRDWAEQPFLTINFDKPPADDLETRLRTFVVDLLKEPGDRSTGTKLILKALERAVGDFSIKILKPNEGFQLLRVPVSELSTQKFSNGQRSTVATALMLMLSELRRQSRSTSAKGASVGTLLLDNPFGNANAGFLIEVQQ
ncbi:MAG TPA: hypothetical protein VJ891_17180, partial [Casimicrobiaceae bacterium]|nr:hypothetical protein [Casimicrobiaceae bacterium]